MPIRSVCLQEAPAGAEEEADPNPEPDSASARAAAQRKYICVCLCDTSRRAAGGLAAGMGRRICCLSHHCSPGGCNLCACPLKIHTHRTLAHRTQDAGEAFFANSFGHCLWRHLGVKLCRLALLLPLLLLLLLLRADSLFGKTRFMWPLARNSNNKSHSKWPWLLCDATDAQPTYQPILRPSTVSDSLSCSSPFKRADFQQPKQTLEVCKVSLVHPLTWLRFLVSPFVLVSHFLRFKLWLDFGLGLGLGLG